MDEVPKPVDKSKYLYYFYKNTFVWVYFILIFYYYKIILY